MVGYTTPPRVGLLRHEIWAVLCVGPQTKQDTALPETTASII